MSPRPRVKVYLDTNVILDDICKRRQESSNVIKQLRANRIPTLTSVFTVSEIFHEEHIKAFLKRHVRKGADIETIFRQRYQRDLPPRTLTRIYNEIRKKFLSDYHFVHLWDLRKKGWEHAHYVTSFTNILPADGIHVATALETGCNIFLTNDSFLLSEIKRDSSLKQLKQLRGLNPYQVEEVFKEMGLF